jgi:hypothetical protein
MEGSWVQPLVFFPTLAKDLFLKLFLPTTLFNLFHLKILYGKLKRPIDADVTTTGAYVLIVLPFARQWISLTGIDGSFLRLNLSRVQIKRVEPVPWTKDTSRSFTFRTPK